MEPTKLSIKRKHIGITQEQLAKLCKLSQSAISHHERRFKYLSLKALFQVSRIMSERGPKVNAADLIEVEAKYDLTEVLLVFEHIAKTDPDLSDHKKKVLASLIESTKAVLE